MNDPLAAYRSGSTEPWAVSVLQALVRLKRPKRLLELGTYQGRTTAKLAEVMPPDATLTTVDHEVHHDGFTDPRVTFVESDAVAYLERSGEVDFVFVDDDHNPWHVRNEVRLLWDKTSPGGLIVMHDVIGPFGLDKVIAELGGFVIELPLLHAAGGLGVVQR